MPFAKLGLHPDLLRGVRAMGFVDPMPIQIEAVPTALSGVDLLGCAQTGSGKTAVFAWAILDRILRQPKPGIRALILAPTRELAAQVETMFRDCGRFTSIRAAVVIGGVGFHGQKKAVAEGAQVLVATPGRLLDHLRRGAFKLDKIEILVLDEADRMLDMGFLPDIRDILSRLPKHRQTMMFSATLMPEVERVASFTLKDPRRIDIAPPATMAEGISQVVYPVQQTQKAEFLAAWLKATEVRSVLVFCRTRHGADRLAKRLKAMNFSVGLLHAARTQGQRTQTMEAFRQGRIRMLVATDIAARGIDVREISHVVNYDVPRHPEDYVHRVGRTGRAYAVGDAVTLMDREEQSFLTHIERFVGVVFPRALLPGFPYLAPPRLDAPKPKTLLDVFDKSRRGRGVKRAFFGP
ncbi:MAG: DEAD/DEAH box helicase [Elusimicrobia bacterium]|nr:DEAD/DEAH box helicase [Elusimicrobiota bacterium]